MSEELGAIHTYLGKNSAENEDEIYRGKWVSLERKREYNLRRIELEGKKSPRNTHIYFADFKGLFWEAG